MLSYILIRELVSHQHQSTIFSSTYTDMEIIYTLLNLIPAILSICVLTNQNSVTYCLVTGLIFV